MINLRARFIFNLNYSKMVIFSIGWLSSTNQSLVSKTKIIFPGPASCRVEPHFYIHCSAHGTCRFWLYTFLMYEILSSRKKEKIILKVIIRKLPIRRKWHSETKNNIESIFCFLLRSSVIFFKRDSHWFLVYFSSNILCHRCVNTLTWMCQ